LQALAQWPLAINFPFLLNPRLRRQLEECRVLSQTSRTLSLLWEVPSSRLLLPTRMDAQLLDQQHSRATSFLQLGNLILISISNKPSFSRQITKLVRLATLLQLA